MHETLLQRETAIFFSLKRVVTYVVHVAESRANCDSGSLQWHDAT